MHVYKIAAILQLPNLLIVKCWMGEGFLAPKVSPCKQYDNTFSQTMVFVFDTTANTVN